MKAAEFTKENPCNKIDIWNCFRGPNRRFVEVDIVRVRGAIGRHVPGHLLTSGKASIIRGGDIMLLTRKGEAWLKSGTSVYLRNQIKKGNKTVLSDVSHPMSSWLEEFS